MLNADPPPPIGAMLDELLGATESQVLRIVELAEAAKDDAIREDVLAPLRPRLAQLKPGRKLRLARLLFTPLDGLIVPAALWRPGQPAVPRDALMPIAAGVRAALGAEAVAIEQMIAGHTTLRQDIVGQAGALLWPRAAECLDTPVPAIGWEASGLAPRHHAPIAQSIATVLRHATTLRGLAQEEDAALPGGAELALARMMPELADANPEGVAMVFRLVLAAMPHAVPMLRRLAQSSGSAAERPRLRRAVQRAIDDVLGELGDGRGPMQALRDSLLAGFGRQARRLVGLLEDLHNDPENAGQRGLVREATAKLDALCRHRFTAELRDGVLAPLGGASVVDAHEQRRLEGCARALRGIDQAGRLVGGAAEYDALLAEAHDSVRQATEAGSLSRVRGARLGEILSGPGEAEAVGRGIG